MRFSPRIWADAIKEILASRAELSREQPGK
jgi:hypothetical protein